MITFKKIEYKNFMSVGNVPIVMNLNEKQLTLIAGKNGNGKSTVIEAITFALYGKAFRNINKNQLINSINQKQCLTTIEFSTGDSEYKVIRGIKPNIFEIYKNDELLNQDASSKDYQKILEQQILGISYKVFTQVVILGSATFTPFMQLPLAGRREVIDDILDIRIITNMNQILKNLVSDNKQKLQLLDANIQNSHEQALSQKRLIDTLKATIEKQKSDGDERTKALNEEMKTLEVSYEKNDEKIKSLKEKYDAKIGVKDILKGLETDIIKTQTIVSSKTKTKDSMASLDVCPTCLQDVDKSHVENICSNIGIELSEYATITNDLELRKSEILKEVRVVNALFDELSNLNSEQTIINNNIKNINRQLMENSKVETIDVSSEIEKLDAIVKKGKGLLSDKKKSLSDKETHDVALALLKDNGVKTTIIREYLPLMNNLINGFLQEMDSYVSFTFDENFNEKITSRFRDLFSYSSFSEGEKARINVAILFCWREIARLKNSVHTNLLFLDEIVDSSMDYDGINYVMGMLEKMDGNVFVISHRQESQDKFHNVIEFEKQGDFTLIKKNK